MVGLAKADDAAVYQLNAEQAIINTTDFFPPVVDDGYDFGAIAAANALSDIYAMGGEVLYHEFDGFGPAPGVDVEATTIQVRGTFRF